MKKILFSIFTIAIVAVVAAGATQALFSDTEESTGNTFTAGTLDLKVDDTDSPVSNIEVTNMTPGDTEFKYWVLKNTGTVDGQPSITFSAIVNNDNGLTEPESDVDLTGGDDEGELGSNAYAMMKWRQGGGAWQSIRLTNNCGNPLLNGLSDLTVGEGLLTGCSTDNALPVLSEGDEVEVEFRVWIQNSIGNIIQSDSALFDVQFNLEQV